MNSRLSKTINAQRVNPEFIGIAEKLSDHKKNRLRIEKERMNRTTNFKFIKKMDQTLEKDLDHQRKELERVRKVRERYNQDMRNKMEEERLRQQRIEFLHNRSMESRVNHKRNMNQAIDGLMTQRKTNHKQMQHQINEIRANNRLRDQQLRLQRQYQYHSIENGKHEGNLKVNQFFRIKNKESVDQYNSRIKLEDKKKRNHKNVLKKLEKNLKKYTNQVQRKKSELEDINSEIQFYAGDLMNVRSRYKDRFQVFSQHSERSNNSKKMGSPYAVIANK